MNYYRLDEEIIKSFDRLSFLTLAVAPRGAIAAAIVSDRTPDNNKTKLHNRIVTQTIM